MKMNRHAQGEIFGLALLFVLLIFGVIIYAQFKALDPEFNEDSLTTTKYKILSENTLSSLKRMSTPCSVQTGKNSLSDLMRYCMEFSRGPQYDPELQCDIDGSGVQNVPICSYSFNLLSNSIQELLSNQGDGIGMFPFSLHIYNEHLEHEVWHERVITNINDSNYGFTDSSEFHPLLVSSQEISYISLNSSSPNHYLRKGFNRVNAGKDELTSGRNSLELELNLYYK